MARIPQIVQHRRLHRRTRNRSTLAWLGLGFATLVGLLIAILLIFSSVLFAKITRSLPSLDLFPLYLDVPNGLLLQPTRLYDRTGEHVLATLAQPAAVDNPGLPLEDIPEVVIQATLASVDPTYWQNPGFTFAGLSQGSHPTLAQRLVSSFFLQDDPPGLIHNLREQLLAWQIVRRFGREKVLEWYLNTAEYGPLLPGINAAAQAYFGKPVSDLSLSEAAALVAYAETPNLDPLVAEQALLEKRNQILQEMLVQGWISSTEFSAASSNKLDFLPALSSQDLSPALTRLVFEQLAPLVSEDKLTRGGYRIITTLDYDLQLQVLCTANTQIAHLQAQAVESAALDGSPCLASRLLPTTQSSADKPFKANVSVVVLDPQTGQVLSLLHTPEEDLAEDALPERDPGSLLTPFLYLTAFTRGLNPSSLIWDIPPSSTESLTEEPSSPEETSYGPMRLRTALANDYPGPVTQLWNQLGRDNISRTARLFGLEDEKKITLLEAAQVFAIFAGQGVNNGQQIVQSGGLNNTQGIRPSAVLRLEDYLGNSLLDWSTPQSQVVLSPQLAYLMNHVLSDESARWSSLGHPNPLEIGRTVGAKIGKTDSQTQEWTVGYTPQRVAGVLIESAEEVKTPVPSLTSASLWHAIMQYATRSLPLENWTAPPGIKVVKVCDPSGMLPTADCPAIVAEVFLDGNEPAQPDNLYRRIQINRETGKLATVFTPPELVEERVYLVVPPEATAWALENNLPIPPDSYDTIYSPSEASSTLQINSPSLFEHVRGKVTFQGSAAGEDFKFYRLQVGAGLNPQEWIQIGQDSSQPITDGILGTWETTGLSGLYAVQLIVVREDQSIDRFVSQVSVDNQPPQLELLSPLPEQVISAKSPTLLFQADASDDLELAKVDFYLDDQRIASLTKPSYTLPWQTPSTGTHDLRVVATDLAGNTSESELSFVIK
jgi:membrane peptidoglycan carboxypeptidase